MVIDVDPSAGPQRIVVTVCQIAGDKIRLGIQADRKTVQIARGELVDAADGEVANVATEV